MLDPKDCCLVIVDVQGKLAQLMHNNEVLFRNICILIESARILDIPILWCQQSPDSLGPTVRQIAELLRDNTPIDKSSFSCCGEEQFSEELRQLNRRQVILTGIETHVCVYQTAVDLLRTGYEVHAVADAVSSRTLENRQIGLSRMQQEGAKIGSTEMALFEILRDAAHPKFKQIARLIK
jgi:nicotinamidase-related amidase